MVDAVRWKYMACKICQVSHIHENKVFHIDLVRNKNKTGAEMRPTIICGIITGVIPTSLWLFSFPLFSKWRIIRIENVRLNILIVNLFMHSIIKDRMRLFWVLFLLGVTMFCMCVEWMRKKKMAR